MTHEKERFRARNGKGKEYVIIRYQEHLSANDFAGKDEVAGLESYETLEGLFVNRIDAEMFQIVETGEHIKKI